MQQAIIMFLFYIALNISNVSPNPLAVVIQLAYKEQRAVYSSNSAGTSFPVTSP